MQRWNRASVPVGNTAADWDPEAVRSKMAADKKSEPKAKRPLPKIGSMNARVLAALKLSPCPVDSDIIGARVDSGFDHEDPQHWKATRNALSSLRTGGHVVSEGSGRAKLWRLA